MNNKSYKYLYYNFFMKVNNKHYKTIWMEGSSVFMINQNALPFSFEIIESKKYQDTINLIKDMTVRGAGAIGAAAGFAMAQAFIENSSTKELLDAKDKIEDSRPTAQNLFYATSRVFAIAITSEDPAKTAFEEADRIGDEDAKSCMSIGLHGSLLIKPGMRILTHCNAGWLAFVDYGTALSPIYTAESLGKKVFIYVDETRPRGQGARLTAWELKNENIDHLIILDSAGAYFMSKGLVDMVIVGADRIAINGDVANKIGTLEKAIVAKNFNVPFYVAAPISTIDKKGKSGFDINIENRSQDEILYQTGLNSYGKLEKFLVCSPGSNALNPAFDITPANYISGIITEKGIINPNDVSKLYK